MGVGGWKKMCTFAVEIPRGGAVVARWAHNPKVVSSSLAPATKISRAGLQHSIPVRFFCSCACRDDILWRLFMAAAAQSLSARVVFSAGSATP